MEIVNNPAKFKGLAHDEEERETLKLRGLLPAAIRSDEQQISLCIDEMKSYETNLERYTFLRNLQDMNEHLFYQVLCRNIEEILPIIYTPTVGEACMHFSRGLYKPRGIFITSNDRGRIQDVLGNWPEESIKAITVTDGERILGLGDLGANGMGIAIGKITLCTAVALIPPSSLLPVMMDVGTNNKELLDDPYYIGLKQERLQGEDYDGFVDEFMQAVTNKYGKSCLIQFEDFANKNAFRLLGKYQMDYCTFNDDMQGTASVVLAGIINAAKITGIDLQDHIFLFVGAGLAALGIAHLLVHFLKEAGVPEEDLRKNIWMTDTKGLITDDRSDKEMTPYKKPYAKRHDRTSNLEEIMLLVKPTVLIGSCGQPGIFSARLLILMLRSCSHPVIFALSNPSSKAECTAVEAFQATEGNCLFASGSPFGPFTYNGQEQRTSQANNLYIFPALNLAVTACKAKLVNNQMLAVASRALADQVTRNRLAAGRIYPPIRLIATSALNTAIKIAEYIFENNLSNLQEKPNDIEAFVTSMQYNYYY